LTDEHKDEESICCREGLLTSLRLGLTNPSRYIFLTAISKGSGGSFSSARQQVYEDHVIEHVAWLSACERTWDAEVSDIA
jgi:hypothetical protein